MPIYFQSKFRQFLQDKCLDALETTLNNPLTNADLFSTSPYFQVPFFRLCSLRKFRLSQVYSLDNSLLLVELNLTKAVLWIKSTLNRFLTLTKFRKSYDLYTHLCKLSTEFDLLLRRRFDKRWSVVAEDALSFSTFLPKKPVLNFSEIFFCNSFFSQSAQKEKLSQSIRNNWSYFSIAPLFEFFVCCQLSNCSNNDVFSSFFSPISWRCCRDRLLITFLISLLP